MVYCCSALLYSYYCPFTLTDPTTINDWGVGGAARRKFSPGLLFCLSRNQGWRAFKWKEIFRLYPDSPAGLLCIRWCCLWALRILWLYYANNLLLPEASQQRTQQAKRQLNQGWKWWRPSNLPNAKKFAFWKNLRCFKSDQFLESNFWLRAKNTGSKLQGGLLIRVRCSIKNLGVEMEFMYWFLNFVYLMVSSDYRVSSLNYLAVS